MLLYFYAKRPINTFNMLIRPIIRPRSHYLLISDYIDIFIPFISKTYRYLGENCLIWTSSNEIYKLPKH